MSNSKILEENAILYAENQALRQKIESLEGTYSPERQQSKHHPMIYLTVVAISLCCLMLNYTEL